MKFDGINSVGAAVDFLNDIKVSKVVPVLDTMAVQTNVSRWTLINHYTFLEGTVSMGVAPQGSSLTAQLLRNDIPVADIEVPDGSKTGFVYLLGTTDPIDGILTGNQGDVFSVNVNTVGSSIPGSYMQVQLKAILGEYVEPPPLPGDVVALVTFDVDTSDNTGRGNTVTLDTVTYNSGGNSVTGVGGSMTIGKDGKLTISPPPNDPDAFYFPVGIDFTFEFWYKGAAGSSGYICSFHNIQGAVFLYPTASSGNIGGITSSGRASNPNVTNTYYAYMTAQAPAQLIFDNTTWNHCALTRSGDVWRWFENGVLRGIVDDTGVSESVKLVAGAPGGNLTIGYFGGGSNSMQGTYDHIKFTRGSALYTSNFTPVVPTTTFPPPQSLTEQILVTSSNDSYNQTGSALVNISGFWSNFNTSSYNQPLSSGDTDGSVNQGSFQNDAMELKKCYVAHNTSTDEYSFVFSLEGLELSSSYFDSIQVHHIGTLNFGDATRTLEATRTQWTWTITQQQYSDIVADSGISVEINNQSWYNSTELVILPAENPVNANGAERNGFYFNNVEGVFIGAAANKDGQLTHGIFAVSCNTFASANLGQSTDRLLVQLGQSGRTNTAFGAIRIPGFGNFTSQTALITNGSVWTNFEWTIKHRTDEFTGLNFPTTPTTITLDTTLFSANRGINSVRNDASSIFERRGYSQTIPGRHPQMGSIASGGGSFNGRTIMSILVMRTKSNNHCVLDFYLSGNATGGGAFNYIEKASIGRFYEDEAVKDYVSSENVTRFTWNISLTSFNSWPTSSTVVSDIQIN